MLNNGKSQISFFYFAQYTIRQCLLYRIASVKSYGIVSFKFWPPEILMHCLSSHKVCLQPEIAVLFTLLLDLMKRLLVLKAHINLNATTKSFLIY